MPIIKTSNNNSPHQENLTSARFRTIFNSNKKIENKGKKIRYPLRLIKRLDKNFSSDDLEEKYSSLIKNREDKRRSSDDEYRILCIKTAIQLKRQENTFDKFNDRFNYQQQATKQVLTPLKLSKKLATKNSLEQLTQKYNALVQNNSNDDNDVLGAIKTAIQLKRQDNTFDKY